MTDDSPFARVVRVPRTGSTNEDLRAAAAVDLGSWPHLSVLVADHQDAGRGRAGRTWVTPPGTALTASVLLRTEVPRERLGWVPLLAGLAVQRACERLLTGAGAGAGAASGVRTGVKWPNDVLALGVGTADVERWGRDRKLAGILAEVMPGGGRASAVVVGIGLNVAQTELPVPWATSLRLLGADVDPAAALEAVGAELAPLLDAWEAAGGDADASGLHARVRETCVTLGRRVRAEQAGGGGPAGRAVDLDADGRLLIDTGDAVEAVAAGDVWHVRTEPTAD
ncbi:biotin--[acetyl-CoA-carboxylase] ligase [Georgenia daeguensis]|uniref:biotin--[biotin carboxyl-carrier protein] ligase n=1 Tax=Georgenia daeguensis TaxID=908355 RepID=A0ABP6UJZ7_9MICO